MLFQAQLSLFDIDHFGRHITLVPEGFTRLGKAMFHVWQEPASDRGIGFGVLHRCDQFFDLEHFFDVDGDHRQIQDHRWPSAT